MKNIIITEEQYKVLTKENSPDDYIPKIKSLMYSGDPSNMELAIQLAASVNLDVDPLFKEWIPLFKAIGWNVDGEAKLKDYYLKLAQRPHLIIEGGDLKNLPQNIGVLTKLTLLVVNGTGLQRLPKSIGNLKNLKALEVRRNDISFLPDTIGGLSSLTRLNVSLNPLFELPESIGNLHNLERLYLRKCKLKKMPESISNLQKNLKDFDAEENYFDSEERHRIKRELPFTVKRL